MRLVVYADVPDLFEEARKANPELNVVVAGDEAALKEALNAGTVGRGGALLKHQVPAPVVQLGSVERLEVEVWPLDLSTQNTIVQTCNIQRISSVRGPKGTNFKTPAFTKI